VLRGANHSTLDFGPVNTGIKGLVNVTNHTDGVAANHVEAKRHLDRGLGIVRGTDNALNCAL